MSELRDKFKKITGYNSKIISEHDCENRLEINVKMFNPRYVDWLERKLTNLQKQVDIFDIDDIINEYKNETK